MSAPASMSPSVLPVGDVAAAASSMGVLAVAPSAMGVLAAAASSAPSSVVVLGAPEGASGFNLFTRALTSSNAAWCPTCDRAGQIYTHTHTHTHTYTHTHTQTHTHTHTHTRARAHTRTQPRRRWRQTEGKGASQEAVDVQTAVGARRRSATHDSCSTQ